MMLIKKTLYLFCLFVIGVSLLPQYTHAQESIPHEYIQSVVSIRVEMQPGIRVRNLSGFTPYTLVLKTYDDIREYLKTYERKNHMKFDDGYAKSLRRYLEPYSVRGSGTIFTKNSLILTNAHVVYDDVLQDASSEIYLSKTENLQKKPVCWAKGEVLAYNSHDDLAIIQPTKLLNENCEETDQNFSTTDTTPFIPLRKSLIQNPIPEIGEALTVIGYPGIGGESVTVKEGIVSGYLYDQQQQEEINAIKTSADIDAGNSGGAALDTNGQLIGIPSFGAFDSIQGAKLNGVISLNKVNQWLTEIEKEEVIQLSQPQNENCFPDISKEHPQAYAICELKNNNIIGGYSDGTFGPDNIINRAEMVKLLISAQGISPSIEEYKNCFPDVQEQWFAPYICFALEQGYVGGYPNGTFQPEKSINNAESLKMILNMFQININSSSSQSSFLDVSSDQWFAPFVETSQKLNILEDSSAEYFYPSQGTSRKSLSQLLYKLLVVQRDKSKFYQEASIDKKHTPDFHHENGHILFRNTMKWKANNLNATSEIVFSSPEDYFNDPLVETIEIFSAPQSQFSDLDSFTTFSEGSLNEEYKNIKQIEAKSEKLKEIPANTFTHTGEHTDRKSVKIDTLIFEKDGYYFQIRFVAEENMYNQYSTQFQTFLENIEFYSKDDYIDQKLGFILKNKYNWQTYEYEKHGHTYTMFGVPDTQYAAGVVIEVVETTSEETSDDHTKEQNSNTQTETPESESEEPTTSNTEYTIIKEEVYTLHGHQTVDITYKQPGSPTKKATRMFHRIITTDTKSYSIAFVAPYDIYAENIEDAKDIINSLILL